MHRKPTSAQQQIIAEYRKNILRWFAAPTEDDRIAAHSKMREDEWILQRVFHMSKGTTHHIYSSEYMEYYSKKGIIHD